MSPTIHPETPRVAVACRCALGEEPVWDARTGGLIWVDIEDPAVWRHWPDWDETRRLPLDEKLGFALPTPDPEMVVAGFRSGLARLHLTTGERAPILAPETDRPGNRLNSGQIGPDGAIYFGTMDDAEAEPTGTFYRYDGRSLHAFGGASAVTNGPVASADGRTLYTIDTAAGVIRASSAGSRPGEAREIVRFEHGWGKPDGLTVDADEHLWICHYGGSRITRFRPDGTIERIVPVPTSLVTKCTFGGPDLTTLYVTTCLRGRDPTIDPMAGHLFVLETGIRGLPVRLCEL
ncbi:SMP-30/gluconolactonase/LRE family protein [uncultured Methylobacterium sp.]|jgi:sugar lactone lactonase YvrE|uniref:SMP-30/gluconolactonase/LRE family protein n=1 Tax=uncultured Methylobacterium sp. TaxID=157278 RepID=UPI0026154A1D|nr:SMP-30/gluconolactonase/LRE family protein [uncultured Methylobacterium sp.]